MEPDKRIYHEVKVRELTPNEIDILRRLGRGDTHREIAQDTERSPQTISSTVQTIYDKLHARNRYAAFNNAVLLGLMSLDDSNTEEEHQLELPLSE